MKEKEEVLEIVDCLVCRNLHGRKITPCGHSDVELVNKSGYIPTEARVGMYMQAGRSLKEVMNELSLGDYDDSELDDHDEAFSRDMDKDYDIADAHQDEMRLSAEIKETVTKSSKKEKADVDSLDPKTAGAQPPQSPSAEDGQ